METAAQASAHGTRLRRPVKTSRVDMGTRELLLEAAGLVFAEKGFDRATGKEICERADANTAAINYHFGGTKGLYDAVVQEAHSRLTSVEAMSAAAAGHSTPDAKFRAVLEVIVRTANAPLLTSWAIRIICREFLHRSGLDAQLEKRRHSVLRFMSGIVAELMGLPQDHPAVARGTLMVMGPLVMLLISDRQTLKRALPGLGLSPADSDSMVHDMVLHGLAGLREIARNAKVDAKR